jgi:hypothetical protein
MKWKEEGRQGKCITAIFIISEDWNLGEVFVETIGMAGLF